MPPFLGFWFWSDDPDGNPEREEIPFYTALSGPRFNSWFAKYVVVKGAGIFYIIT